jgi:uncharacterized protein
MGALIERRRTMLWAICCFDKTNTTIARGGLLTVHRNYLDANVPNIFFSGPLQSDDAEQSLGSLFILNVKSRDEAQAFIDNEPFNNAGVFEKVNIFRIRKGRFNPHLADVI